MTTREHNFTADFETESPIQRLLLVELRKYCAVPIQTEATTPAKYRLDFALKSPSGRIIAIETDGRQWHTPQKDIVRDTVLIRSGCIDAIYRIEGKDIHRRMGDVLHMLSKREPWAFTPRYRAFCEQLCHPAAHREDSLRFYQGYREIVRRFYQSEHDQELGEPMADCEKITIIRCLHN
jgi:hypothetical protein